MFIKSDGRMIKVDLRDVWFVEGLKNYIMLWTTHGKIIVHSTMKNTGIRLSASAPTTSLVRIREPARSLCRSIQSFTIG